MRTVLTVTAFLALAGCGHKDMPPQEIQARVDECHKLGMGYRILTYTYDEAIARIQCLPTN